MQTPDLSPDAAWAQRFRASSVAWSALATQNPARGLVCSNRDGAYQLYAWDVPTGHLRRLTDAPAGVIQGVISADGERIYYMRDLGGDELGHWHFVPFGGGDPVDISPDMPRYASSYFTECATGRVYGFMTANEYGFMCFVIDNQQGGLPLFRYESGDLSVGPLLSYDGEIAVVATTERSNGSAFSLEAYDIRTAERLHTLWDGHDLSIHPAGFATRDGDMRFLASSSRSGFARPLLWNTRTGERVDLDLPELEGDVLPWDWSSDGRHLLLQQNWQAQEALYTYDLREKRLHRLDTPPGVYGYQQAGYFAPNGSIHTSTMNPATPEHLVELNASTGRIQRVLFAPGNVPPGQPMRSVSFPTDDGTPIQAWLATPPGDGPFPTVVHVHGGPTAATTARYMPDAQAWLDHGCAFCSINYRGSDTFGQEFAHSIYGHPGELEIIDIAAGAQWLVDEGIARPDGLFLTGASYGGFLTLQTLSLRPQIFTGGMAIVAVADWRLMYEDQSESLRGYQRMFFGGAPDDLPELYEQASPITHAETLQGPLLIIQGRSDTRTPERQMLAYVERLQTLGKPVELHWFEAGHARRVIEQSIEHQALMLRFVHNILAP